MTVVVSWSNMENNMAYEEILLKLNEIIKHLPNSESYFSVGDYIAIGVAVLSAFVTIYVGVITNRTNRKISEANIDANLTAKARIDWIQNVRTTTSELIALYYSAINETEHEKMLSTIIKARQKLEQLILFFGPEESKENATRDLFDEDTNDGKNILIVNFLKKYSEDFLRYYKITKSGMMIVAEERVKCIAEKLNVENLTEEDLNNLEKEYAQAELDYKNIEVVYTLLYGKLTWIRDFIRIYLKIEWSKAKQGK